MSVATANASGVEPSGPKPKRLTAGRVGLYAFLLILLCNLLAYFIQRGK